MITVRLTANAATPARLVANVSEPVRLVVVQANARLETPAPTRARLRTGL